MNKSPKPIANISKQKSNSVLKCDMHDPYWLAHGAYIRPANAIFGRCRIALANNVEEHTNYKNTEISDPKLARLPLQNQ